MEQTDFEALVKKLVALNGVGDVLTALAANKEAEVAEAAQGLQGKFQLAEMEGKNRVYHVFTQVNEAGEEEEFAEWVMNEGDELIVFIAWFFYSQFEIKDKETYAAAGIRLVQPKKLK
ncbi:hypothetical protein [Thaumasiovibrio subtropicus]|uniref:hypothetical protein n=1 Tax=Thaumasiovibrio subtropicus TaxID=1891207 RepID=UPI000B35ECC7|nr:hypothetical protein [Thaumasiovibrio subtropicus]